MPRAAGNRNHYTFVLKNLDTGRYRTDVTISLPSVTHIIGATLAKPMLVGWAYRHTRDVMVGLSHVLPPEELIELLSDADDLEEFLKANNLRPDDIKEEAAERGTKAHKLLEKLSEYALNGQEDHAERLAQARLTDEYEEDEEHERAIADWWLTRRPIVIASEEVLVSLTHGFAGTMDLAYYDAQGRVVACDLKNRKAGSSTYDSDHIQTCAYEIAWNEMNPEQQVDYRTVLLARGDGTWVEETDALDARIFLDVLSVYRGLR